MHEPWKSGWRRHRWGLVVRGQVGNGVAWVSRGVIWRQEPHKVKAAGVQAGVVTWSHHQDLLSVVVEGGDAG